VVHNGADRPPGAEGPLPPYDERQPIVLGLGPTELRKGFDTFQEVAAALHANYPDWRWLWVGGDGERLAGVVEVKPWRDDVGALLTQSSLLLIPSRAEGLPLVLLESFACETPVIASSVGGVPEALHDGIDGLLIPPEETGRWIDAVELLLASPRLRASLGAAGAKRWRRDFTAEAMAQRYDALLEELTGRG
jgi:glycosyltransferase involved in cell wall biosynthesis